MKVCYDCRKPIKGKKIFCKECVKAREQDKPVRSSSTLIIYDKI